MIDLTDKVAVLTGAASGMGAAEAELMVSLGAKVVASDLQEQAGKDLEQRLGSEVAFIRHDVTSEADWAAVIAFAEQRFGRIDILVNNAGIYVPQTLEQTTSDNFDRHVAVNQRGVYLGMRAVVQPMVRAGGGAIVNIASGAGLTGSIGMFAYAMTKWAVRGMTRCAAKELGPSNIRVMSVLPGAIATPMIEGWTDEQKRTIAQAIPMDRLGTPKEVAELVAFLVSDRAGYISGAEVTIDGAITA